MPCPQEQGLLLEGGVVASIAPLFGRAVNVIGKVRSYSLCIKSFVYIRKLTYKSSVSDGCIYLLKEISSADPTVGIQFIEKFLSLIACRDFKDAERLHKTVYDQLPDILRSCICGGGEGVVIQAVPSETLRLIVCDSEERPMSLRSEGASLIYNIITYFPLYVLILASLLFFKAALACLNLINGVCIRQASVVEGQ